MSANLRLSLALLAGLSLLAPLPVHAGGAVITIVNIDGPIEGFNDPAPRAPVGGNPGTTLGQQRLLAFQHAATIWGATLDTPVSISIRASFDPLTCTATSAVLGSAGTIFIFRDFPGAEFPGTWYHSALADKRAGVELNPGAEDLVARFNSSIGVVTGCLTGSDWYYGLDNNHPANQIDLVTVLLHEFAHGLGFSQFASVSTGSQIQGLPDVYNRQILDLTTGKTWPQMTNAERVASAINSRRVVWTGSEVTSQLPQVLTAGTPLLRVTAPTAIAGVYAVGAAAFGPPLSAAGITGSVVRAIDPADGAGPTTFDGCSALTNPAAVAGNIALIDRGACTFVVKVKNAQNAGAIAVIIADNAAGSPPAGLGGADPTIVIPSVRITLADGTAIKAQLGVGVTATLGVDVNVYAGADPLGRALLNAPNPVQPGSSISHWDPIAFRNQLMEPAINADLTHSIKPPEDLTLPQMRDVGWFPDADLDGIADGLDACPNSDLRPTVVVGSCDSGVPNPWNGATGCTRADDVLACASGARNHGDFVSCVSALTNTLKKVGAISGNQKGAIQSCAAGSSLP